MENQYIWGDKQETKDEALFSDLDDIRSVKQEEHKINQDKPRYEGREFEMTRGAMVTRDGGAGASFFQKKEMNDDLEAHSMEAINSAFSRALTLIEQRTYSCEIKGLLLLTDAFYRSEERVNYILMNGMDPFEPIDKKIKPSLLSVLQSTYKLQSKELESMKTVLARVQPYLDKPEIQKYQSLIQKKEEGIFQSKNKILANATSSARSLLSAKDAREEPGPPRAVKSLEETQNIVVLFQSPDITARDATPLLNELYRMVDYVARFKEPHFDIVNAFWNGKIYAFVEFSLQSLSWCLTGLAQLKILIREGAAVLGRILKPLYCLIEKCRDRDAMKQSLEESYKDFRTALAMNKFIDDSDYLYEMWKNKEDGELLGGGGQGYRAPPRHNRYQNRGNYNRKNWGGGSRNNNRDNYQRNGQGRGKGRGRGYRENQWGSEKNGDWMSDYNKFKDKQEQEHERKALSSGGGYARGRGRGSSNSNSQPNSQAYGGSSSWNYQEKKKSEDINCWDQDFRIEDKSQLQVIKEEKKDQGPAQEIFQSPGSSCVESDVSYPSYQKEVLDIKNSQMRPWSEAQDRKSVISRSSYKPRSQANKPQKQQKYLDIDSGQEEVKQQVQTKNPEFYDSGWEQANQAEGRLSLNELNMNAELDGDFYQKLSSAQFKEEGISITNLVSQVAQQFKMREQEQAAIGSVCSKIRLAIKRSPFFQGQALRVVPFGSAGNGTWLSGSPSLNLAVLVEEDKLSEINLKEALRVIKALVQKNLNVEAIEVSWGVAPVIRFQFKQQRAGFKFQVFLSPCALCAVLTSQLIRAYQSLDPRFLELSIFLHEWLRIKAVDGKVQELCPPYVLQLLLISFFQSRNPPILPNLQMLRIPEQVKKLELRVLGDKSDEQDKLISMNPHFYSPQKEDFGELLVSQEYERNSERNWSSCGRLLFEFFYFFVIKFQREDWIVCPSKGGFKLKDQPNSVNLLAVQDPFYSRSQFILRAGTTKWDQLYKAFETTLDRFMAGIPILDLEEMGRLKSDKEKCWEN